jgi:hypothetical protein
MFHRSGPSRLYVPSCRPGAGRERTEQRLRLPVWQRRHPVEGWPQQHGFAHARVAQQQQDPAVRRRRMGATTVEVASSHVAMISHPDEVGQLIKTAAAGV